MRVASASGRRGRRPPRVVSWNEHLYPPERRFSRRRRGTPIVRRLPNDAVTGVLLLGASQTTVLTDPEIGVLLLDVIAPATHEPGKALDVFARRLAAREVRSEQRARG